jgi:hypothetical protein
MRNAACFQPVELVEEFLALRSPLFAVHAHLRASRSA